MLETVALGVFLICIMALDLRTSILILGGLALIVLLIVFEGQYPAAAIPTDHSCLFTATCAHWETTNQ